MPSRPAPQGASARTLALLECIATGPAEFTLKELAERAALPQSTAHRLLGPWVRSDLLEHNGPTSYRLGPELFRLASLVTHKFQIQYLARPVLGGLWRQWQETCVLCVFHPATLTATVMDSIASPQPLKYDLPPHSAVSLAWGSLGPAILAHLSSAEIESVLAQNQLGPISRRPLPPAKQVLKELAVIRGRRYALYCDESVDVAGVSASVLQRDGRIIGSIGVVMPGSRFTKSVRARLPATVVDAAAKLSTALLR